MSKIDPQKPMASFFGAENIRPFEVKELDGLEGKLVVSTDPFKDGEPSITLLWFYDQKHKNLYLLSENFKQ